MYVALSDKVTQEGGSQLDHYVIDHSDLALGIAVGEGSYGTVRGICGFAELQQVLNVRDMLCFTAGVQSEAEEAGRRCVGSCCQSKTLVAAAKVQQSTDSSFCI